MTEAMTGYPTLSYFFGGYMHPDWREDHPDEWAVLDDFMRSDPHLTTKFCEEISQLLATDPSEDELRTLLLDEYLAAAMVENRGWRYHDWMQAVAAYIERAVGHPQAS
jgi:hypothetical protein